MYMITHVVYTRVPDTDSGWIADPDPDPRSEVGRSDPASGFQVVPPEISDSSIPYPQYHLMLWQAKDRYTIRYVFEIGDLGLSGG